MVGWTAPQASSTVSESYDLPAGTFGKNGNLIYTLQADPQSLFKASTITVRVTAPNGYSPVETDGMVVDGQTAEVSAVQDRPVNVVVQLAKGR